MQTYGAAFREIYSFRAEESGHLNEIADNLARIECRVQIWTRSVVTLPEKQSVAGLDGGIVRCELQGLVEELLGGVEVAQ